MRRFFVNCVVAFAGTAFTGCVALIPLAERNRAEEEARLAQSRKARVQLEPTRSRRAPLRREQKLLAELSAPDPAARATAASKLGDFGTSGGFAVDALSRAAVQDPNKWVRRSAVKSLAKIGKPEGIPAIRQATNDPDSWVRHSATNALRRLNG